MRRRRRWISAAMAPAKYDLSATATTITDIGDDLLLEIFLRLPSLPSLVRAALACRTFLRAVRSAPAFRRLFQALHPPQVLGFFEDPYGTDTPDFVPLLSRSDPDLAAAVHGSDFLLACLPEDSVHHWWQIIGCRCGYVLLFNQKTTQIAAYNPISEALDIFPCPPREARHLLYLLFHIVFSEEDPRSFRVVCVRRRTRRRRALARFSVFSSDSREWQGFSWVDTSMLQPGDVGGDKCLLPSYVAATQVNESDRLVHWKHKNQAYIVVLNAATLQLSRMDLPPHLKDMESTQFKLGPTKDGKLAVAFMDHFSANKTMLAVWFWRADADGIQKWMPHKNFPLDKFLDFYMCSQEFAFIPQVVAVIDGFVYLSNYGYNGRTEPLLSFCLKTEEVNKLSECTADRNIHPYIMAWPPSLVCNKQEDSETKVTVDGLTDDGPAGAVSQR